MTAAVASTLPAPRVSAFDDSDADIMACLIELHDLGVERDIAVGSLPCGGVTYRRERLGGWSAWWGDAKGEGRDLFGALDELRQRLETQIREGDER